MKTNIQNFFLLLLLFTASALYSQADTAPVQEAGNSAREELLSVTEGDFLIRRIPEIKLKKSPAVPGDPIVKIEETAPPADGKTADPDEEKGLLGLSSGTTDIIIKVFFAALLILIFILYRSRSGVSNRNVMRSIPKR
jgi:hypothetical protein